LSRQVCVCVCVSVWVCTLSMSSLLRAVTWIRLSPTFTYKKKSGKKWGEKRPKSQGKYSERNSASVPHSPIKKQEGKIGREKKKPKVKEKVPRKLRLSYRRKRNPWRALGVRAQLKILRGQKYKKYKKTSVTRMGSSRPTTRSCNANLLPLPFCFGNWE